MDEVRKTAPHERYGAEGGNGKCVYTATVRCISTLLIQASDNHCLSQSLNLPPAEIAPPAVVSRAPCVVHSRANSVDVLPGAPARQNGWRPEWGRAEVAKAEREKAALGPSPRSSRSRGFRRASIRAAFAGASGGPPEESKRKRRERREP